MILGFISKWAPFRVDALGIITILGAEEVDVAVGRLIANALVEYLPLLGAFAVAGNRFVRPLPGFTLYSISDGIMATDVAGWLSRWLSMQKLRWNTTTLIWAVRQSKPRRRAFWSPSSEEILALSVGLVTNFGLLVLTILVEDWFGLANALAMIVSVYVRWYLVRQHREYLDREAEKIVVMGGENSDFVKAFCLLADGRAVTLLAPRGLVVNCFLTTPRPFDNFLYNATRAVGWLAFGCQVICIGQATLFIQILTIVIMLTATVLYVRGIGCEDHHVAGRILVHRDEPEEKLDSRTLAYARLEMSDEEEASMLAWALMPQRSNTTWWEKYRRLKESGP